MSNNFPHSMPPQGNMPPNQQQNQSALGGQYGAPAGSGYAPVPQPQQGQSAPGGRYGAPAASAYAPESQAGNGPRPETGGQQFSAVPLVAPINAPILFW